MIKSAQVLAHVIGPSMQGVWNEIIKKILISNVAYISQKLIIIGNLDCK